jgi:hypothetical protein
MTTTKEKLKAKKKKGDTTRDAYTFRLADDTMEKLLDFKKYGEKSQAKMIEAAVDLLTDSRD